MSGYAEQDGKMIEVIYLGYYDTASNKAENRHYPPPAAAKMEYISKAIVKAGHSVHIVSPCLTRNNESCAGKLVDLDDRISLKLFYSVGAGGFLCKALRRVSMRLQLFFYILKHAKKNEPVLVYHSLSYMNTLRFLKALKGFKLILEVEEVYADVKSDSKLRGKELRFFKKADAYLFAADTLDEIINTEGKPSAVIYGAYNIEGDGRCASIEGGKTHVVYAGTLDLKKGGALAAVSAAKYLDDTFHLHVIGRGSALDTEMLKEAIAGVNSGGCTISYDGFLPGEKCVDFLNSCHIGLSTQNPEGLFNDTSFPSKVLTYLSCGLSVVASDISVLRNSPISSYLYYYDSSNANSIADAILRAKQDLPCDSKMILKELDDAFVRKIDELIESV